MTDFENALLHLLHLLNPMMGDPLWVVALRWILVLILWLSLGLGIAAVGHLGEGMFRLSFGWKSAWRRRARAASQRGTGSVRRSVSYSVSQ